jgi:hypothetical protein
MREIAHSARVFGDTIPRVGGCLTSSPSVASAHGVKKLIGEKKTLENIL